MKKLLSLLLILLSIPCEIFASEYLYILNDKCIEDLYNKANIFFLNTEILPIKDARGIVLRCFFKDPIREYYDKNFLVYKQIEEFLAKIENPAIIEVHVNNFPTGDFVNLRKWEFSTMIANSIEDIITKPRGSLNQERINSIGYGEFLPVNNTSNNGGKNLNRIDIIILCNISGE